MATTIEIRAPLESGDHLTREEFHRRYSAHPEIKKAELIEGVVYVGSPVRFRLHTEKHGLVAAWLGTYMAQAPGTRLGDNATVLLDGQNEYQPDAILLREGAYVRRELDALGILESVQFRGLRLHVPSLLTGDAAGVLAALGLGRAS